MLGLRGGGTSNPHLIALKTSPDLLLRYKKKINRSRYKKKPPARSPDTKNPDVKATKSERYVFQIMIYLVEVKCLRQVHWKIRLV